MSDAPASEIGAPAERGPGSLRDILVYFLRLAGGLLGLVLRR
jgi:hypothetical protein